MQKLFLNLKKLTINLILYFKPSIYKKIKFNTQAIQSLEDQTATIEPELFLLKKFVDKESVVFDIGSNVGDYLYAFERIVTPGNMYGFEPNKNLYNRLKKMFTKANIFNLALSDVSENADLKIPTINNKLYPSRGTLNVNFKEIDEEDYILLKIKKVTLDDFVIENKIPKIDFIKIDVEGHEFNVLKGAVETLKKYKPTLLIEIEQRHHKFSISEIDNFLYALNYKKYFYDKKSKKLLPGESFTIDIHQNIEKLNSREYINNFFFIAAEKLNNKIINFN
jgi:FkbM family methyltransferase